MKNSMVDTTQNFSFLVYKKQTFRRPDRSELFQHTYKNQYFFLLETNRCGKGIGKAIA